MISQAILELRDVLQRKPAAAQLGQRAWEFDAHFSVSQLQECFGDTWLKFVNRFEKMVSQRSRSLRAACLFLHRSRNNEFRQVVLNADHPTEEPVKGQDYRVVFRDSGIADLGEYLPPSSLMPC